MSRRRQRNFRWQQRYLRGEHGLRLQKRKSAKPRKPTPQPEIPRSNPHNPYPMDTVEYWTHEVLSWQKEWKAKGIT